MALKRVWIPSPNYSSRGGSGVRLIVVHTAEGARTIESLGSFFQGNVSASSHTGADDKVNTVGEYVKRGNKAWTQSEFNPVAVAIELCGFASWSTAEWKNNHDNMLRNCAAWIAEEAAHYGLPINRLSSSEAQGSGRGVCGHNELGSRGGGHWDPGPDFPWDYVIDLARGGSGPAPSEEDENLIASAVSDGGSHHVFWVGEDGKTVWYRYQRKNETDWNDGGVLTKSNEKLSGLSASKSASGVLELFARQADGNPVHLWQKPNSTSWSGGEAGKQKAGFTNLPK
jgi:hypothetical protein